ncbi:hypothetical protein [Kushneria phosphatilytica]|uniref:Uncharacterized protein n=1 Tax=Kushneria phosphatilytica TaxID=657387 RepID=A0A1S1NTS0_9GAMM|nr:hypothetical protein [Kushneria phosphatilytica]OHV12969.1 hypothetical protein BH688_02915 [Kushneria phosphatilytica]QEL10838.1 hypothetical protein FY550_06680 [Kushneria phosphatilytica]
MAKSRSLHWQEPATAPCTVCNGSGEWSGMFSTGPCANCDGTGLVGEDGEPLELRELLPMMRRQRDRQRDRLYRLWQTPGVQEAVQAHRQRRIEEGQEWERQQRKRLRGG